MITVRLHVEKMDRDGLSRFEKLSMLRGQLTLIRTRAEGGIPVSVESLASAERIARDLELSEVWP
jgi:hypothetical protein